MCRFQGWARSGSDTFPSMIWVYLFFLFFFLLFLLLFFFFFSFSSSSSSSSFFFFFFPLSFLSTLWTYTNCINSIFSYFHTVYSIVWSISNSSAPCPFHIHCCPSLFQLPHHTFISLQAKCSFYMWRKICNIIWFCLLSFNIIVFHTIHFLYMT